jgi:tRNA(Ile)-lysidine synthase
VRPLLGFSKAEILRFAFANKITFRDDATNLANDFLRNRIRNELLPLLQKEYQPGLMKTVLRLMEITGAETEFVGEVARQWLAKPGFTFEKLPGAVQRRVLQRQFAGLGLVSDFELIEQLRLSAGKAVSVSANLSVLRDAAGKVRLQEHFENHFNADELELKLWGRAGQGKFGGLEIQWALKKYGGSRGRSPHLSESFDADKIGGRIVLRHWHAGDRFQPIGLRSPVKLQDLFVNAKIPAARRRKLVLAATAAGEIFWVEGLRIGEKFKLTPATKRVLNWSCSKLAA